MMNLLLELNNKQKTFTQVLTSVVGLIAFFAFGGSTLSTVGLGTLLALALRNPTVIYVFINTCQRDFIGLCRFVRLNIYFARIDRKQCSIADLFQEVVKRHPEKTCFLMDKRAVTFREAEDCVNRVASYFKSKGLRHGDCVALLMETRPEYVFMWLGLSKIGVITALINSHLRRETLRHSIQIAKAKAIIVGTELTGVLEEVIRNDEELAATPVYQFVDEYEEQRKSEDFQMMKGATDLTEALKSQPIVDLTDDMKACTPRDKLLYVYTSGTTGLPKAAVITNLRMFLMSTAPFIMLAINSDDVIYNPLPLYHTAGGLVAVGNAIVHGCTVILRKKFSASNFWKDCIKFDCTVAQYIGELCRYLLSTPRKPEDTQHRLRLMYGNGLRPQIWSQFVTRFNIPRIGEVYGSTEGNSNLANITGKVGAMGFLPVFFRRLYPVQLIKCDEETGEPLRDSNGRCILCRPGEVGLVIGEVDPRRAVTAYNGYADQKASDKKLIHDVFKKGDSFFNSGDMAVSDMLGYFYFKDRTGDTFRWRGENVATLEVEAIITNVIGLKDCVVYGVDIPHVEGKAGMAAIVDPDHKVDFEHLSNGIRGSLPPYARPLFVRIMKEIPQTATFKMKKRDLMMEGFDLVKVKDPIYYMNKDGVYRPMTEEQYESIQNGSAGL